MIEFKGYCETVTYRVPPETFKDLKERFSGTSILFSSDYGMILDLHEASYIDHDNIEDNVNVLFEILGIDGSHLLKNDRVGFIVVIR